MKYRANPVEVDAWIIISVGRIYSNGSMDIATQDGRNHNVGKEMIARYIPQEGDYLVVQHDGYVYLNPKSVFERKYSPINSQ